MAIFPGEPEFASFLAAKEDGSGGDNLRYKKNKAAIISSPPTNQYPAYTGWMLFLP